MNRIAALCALVAVGFMGCGKSDLPELGTVSGVVTLDGQPLSNAIVSFNPTGEGRPSAGQTDDDGNYALLYVADAPGALIGQHKVTVKLIVDEGADDLPDDPADLDPGQEYGPTLPANAGDGSILKDVGQGRNEINIELESDG